MANADARETLKVSNRQRRKLQDEVSGKLAKRNPRPDDEYLPVSCIEDVLQVLPEHGLAMTFKVLLHFYSQEDTKIPMPKYESIPYKHGGLQGFIGSCKYRGNLFQSAGLMCSGKQAELSAAEMCLRCLGYLPLVEEDQLTIQPYRGGYWGDIHARYHLFLTNVSVDFGFNKPKFRIEITGNENQSYKCICIIAGKIFEGESALKVSTARHKISEIVLQYFGVSSPRFLMQYGKQYKVKKHKMFVSLPQISPFAYCPSGQKGWLHTRNEFEPVKMTGEDVDVETRNAKFKPNADADENLFEKITGMPPEFQCIKLDNLENISVAEVFPDQPDIVRIGNNEFSIMMYCKDRKLFCKQRKKDVSIMPGHQIKGLTSSYKVAFPSSYVYLKAEDCLDLFFPNPPLPVVTQCKAVALMHDHEAGGEVYVLLKRKVEKRKFFLVAYTLKWYLKRLIENTDDIKVSLDVNDVTKSISTWTLREVQLLSEMTVESIQELFSTLFKYDERCNELFFQELTPDLAKLKEACTKELANRKRTRKKDPQDKSDKLWSLPSNTFNHRLTASGIYTHTDIFTMYHGMSCSTGLRIKLNEIENCRTFDEPNKSNPNPHRGDVTRYFIWRRYRPISKNDKDTYYEEEEIGLDQSDANWLEKDEQPKQKTHQNRNENDEPDESKNQNESSEKKEAVYSTESTEKLLNSGMTRDTHQNEEPLDQELKSINEEVRWCKIEEAKKMCPEFAQISTREEFIKELDQLKQDGAEFMSKKGK